jgi:hypothetical protein
MRGGFEDGMDLAIPPIRIRSMISLNYPESQSIPLVVGLHFSSIANLHGIMYEVLEKWRPTTNGID